MITPVEVGEIPKLNKRHWKSSKFEALLDDLNEFVDSGYEMCEITEYKYKDAKSTYYAIRYATKRHGLNVKPMLRNDRVFVLRGDADD